MPRAVTDVVELLRHRASQQPAEVAYIFADGNGTERPVDYAWVDRRARAVAAALASDGLRPGERVLLMFAPGADYVVGFFGCLYAGVIAVPVYPPEGGRGLERVLAVLGDCAPAAIASTSDIVALAEAQFGRGGLRWVAADTVPDAMAEAWTPVRPATDADAFLQYTSGSTASPKGVRVTHANLLHNSAVIGSALGLGPGSVGVSWLPPYHDLGLIGGVLQPLYGGFPCVLMPPAVFLRQPRRWLEAISRHRGTISAAPDFAYAACVRRIPVADRAGLDLSSWSHALVGAETVRPASLRAFADAFGPCGLPATALYPCYGLAEATLFVTGAPAGRAQTVLEVDREQIANGAVAAAPAGTGLALTSCGHTHGADEVRVVDPDTGTPCPSDVVGEVWVSGPTVAAGYWNAPGDPAFGARLAGDDRAWLRTGDLGFRHDDELYLVGRAKEVLVVRGRNHHPHDLELTAESADPRLRPHRGAAFAVPTPDGNAVVLVHEVIREFRDDDRATVLRAIRQAVVAEHGVALHEVLLVRGGTIPRTSSGKIRRAACREAYLAGALVPAGSDVTVAEPAPPVQAAQTELVAGIVAEVLRTDAAALATDETLVGLGLDSLTAAELQAALSARAGLTVTADQLLGRLTVGELQAWPPDAATTPPDPDLDRSTDLEPVPASSGQHRLWVLHRADPDSTAYHVGAGVRLRGPLDVGALADALRRVRQRHTALRTSIRLDDDGVLRQHVHPDAALPLEPFDLSAVAAPARNAATAECAAEFLGRPFDLSGEPPIRAMLIRLDEDDHHLVVAAHHAIVDAASLRIVFADLATLYRAQLTGRPEPPARPVPQFRDWSRGEPAGERAADLDYWRERLRGADVLRLPAPPPGARAGDAAVRVDVDLPEAMVSRVRQAARRTGATPFMMLLAGFAAVLTRWTGQREAVIATALAGRNRPGAAGVVGFLANTVAIRLPTHSTVEDLLAQARSACLEAYAHGNAPFDRVIEAVQPDRSAGHPPLAQAMLALRRLPAAREIAAGLTAEPYEVPAGHAQFDIALQLIEHPDGRIGGVALARPDALATDDLERIVAAYGRVLPALADQTPQRPVDRLPVQSPAERTRAVAVFGRGPVIDDEGLCLHQLIERQVDATPDRVAVVYGGTEVSYRELDERANRLAHRLIAAGVAIETPVGICVPRSVELVVAVLAVLKTGGAYVPLDPDYPAARLDFMLADAGAGVLIAHPDSIERFDSDPAVSVIDVTATDSGPTTRPGVRVCPDNLAYVIYTSGSTGTPKGVMNAHRGVVNRIRWGQRRFPLDADEAVLFKTPFSFDVAGEELYWPLITGARLVVARPGGHREADYLADVIRTYGVTTVHFVPSMLNMFLAQDGATGCAAVLRRLVCSGEPLAPALGARVHAVLPGTRLFNFYGPTEAAIEVLAAECHPGEARITIGTPIDNTRAYVLDAHGEPAPVGVAGELHIGGVPVARGYWRRPGLTARAFVPDPFGYGTRLYRSGDQVRLLGNGSIDYLGRLDQQVKIRGVRIELGEVEAALAAHPQVRAAAVDLRPGPGGSPRLVAYLVAPGSPPSAAELRAHLADRLPAAMLPAAYVLVPALPLSPSGKLDRGALPEPETAAPPEYVGPRTAVEEVLAQIWADVLSLDRVSIRDDFFDLGGHSLLATQVLARVRGELGVEPPVAELLSGQSTVEHLAEVIAQRQLADADPDDLLALIAELDDA